MSSRPSQIIGHKNQTASQGNYNPELSGIYVKGTSFFYTFVKITNAIFCHESNYLLFFLPAPIHLPSAPGDGRYGCCTKSQPVRKNIQTFLFRPGRRYPSARRFQGSRMVPYHRRNQLSHFAELTGGSRLYVISPLQGIGGTAQPVLPVRLRFASVRDI